MRTLANRLKAWTVWTAAGGSLLVIDGCNPNVRDTVLAGVQSAATGLSTTFIQAFFEGLEEDDQIIVKATPEIDSPIFS